MTVVREDSANRAVTTLPPATTAPYQKRSGVLEATRIGFVRLLGTLPPSFARSVFLAFADEHSDRLAIARGAGTWRALEVLYAYPHQPRAQPSILDRGWHGVLDNGRSVANRLALVKEEICLAAGRSDGEIRILSIGSGSARPVLESVLLLHDRRQVSVMLVDVDDEALRFSEALGQRLSVDHTTRQSGNFLRLTREAAEFAPNIVEVVGLLDYLSDEAAVRLLRTARDALAVDGVLIAGNIAPNPEAAFVEKALGWKMEYRSARQLCDLLLAAGFQSEHVRMQQEPLGIHIVAVATRASRARR